MSTTRTETAASTTKRRALPPLMSLSERAARAGSAADVGLDVGLPPRAELPRHARVVLLGDFLGPLDAVRATVAALAAIPVTGHLVQVLDPAETALPYSGRVRFRDVAGRGAAARSAAPGPGGGAEVLVPRVEGLREAYAEALAAQQAGLASICRTAGFGFAVHHTDQPPERALLALYAALSGPVGGAANGAVNGAGGPGFAAGGGTAGAGAQGVASGVPGTDADGPRPGRAADPVRGA